MGGDTAIEIIDISDPTNPKLTSIALIDTSSAAFDCRIWNNYLYIADGRSWGGNFSVVYDVSDITKPIYLDTFPSAHNITIDDRGFMYASCAGLRILDLNASPTKPEELFYDGRSGIGCHDIAIFDTLLANFQGESWPYKVDFYNIADPYNPLKVDSLAANGINFSHSGAFTKDGKHLLICNEKDEGVQEDITIWDITTPANAIKVAHITDNFATPHNVVMHDTLAYVSYYHAGFRVYNFADPSAPTLVYEQQTDTLPVDAPPFEGAFGVAGPTRDGHILISDRNNGLFIFKTPLSSITAINHTELQLNTHIYPSVLSRNMPLEVTTSSQILSLDLINAKGLRMAHFKGNTSTTQNFNFGNHPEGIYTVVLRLKAGRITESIMITE